METIGQITFIETKGWVIKTQDAAVEILPSIIEENQDWFDSLLIIKRQPYKSFDLLGGYAVINFKDMFDITDLNYQLGLYVGHYIVMKHLPTLSTDALKSNVIIDVTPEEAAEYEKLEQEWVPFDANAKNSNYRFKLYRDYADSLAIKYLAPELKVMVPKVYPKNMETFKKGIYDSIWDCDLSHYMLEDDFFEQTMGGAWCSYINLKLSINPYIIKE